jgi:hypothetical protein
VLLASCGTEPSPDLGGVWSVTASYAGGTLSCTVLATLALNVSGSSVSGSFAENEANCSENGTPLTITPDTSNVIGTVDGRGLSFTPQPSEGDSPCAVFHFTGQVADDRISGTVQTSPVFCQGTYVEMTGTWQAQHS